MESTLAATPKARLAAMTAFAPPAELPPTVRTRMPAPGPAFALPELPESAWTILGRAWFFLAGTTMGVLFAAALIAIYARPIAPPAPVPGSSSSTSARVLVIEKPAAVAERDLGQEAAPPPPVKRVAVAARKPSTRRHGSAADILSAGL